VLTLGLRRFQDKDPRRFHFPSLDLTSFFQASNQLFEDPLVHSYFCRSVVLGRAVAQYLDQL
jgi:hypothetical protein